jgi:hypothetical protein
VKQAAAPVVDPVAAEVLPVVEAGAQVVEPVVVAVAPVVEAATPVVEVAAPLIEPVAETVLPALSPLIPSFLSAGAGTTPGLDLPGAITDPPTLTALPESSATASGTAQVGGGPVEPIPLWSDRPPTAPGLVDLGAVSPQTGAELSRPTSWLEAARLAVGQVAPPPLIRLLVGLSSPSGLAPATPIAVSLMLALAALAALAPPALGGRMRLSMARLRPPPFLSLLERPG